ncbi:MAG TPA: HNH endonuclease [Polyangiaceae bacterium]|nr:HNH endonuclease [Polyangiaceae bacterium]
MTERGFWELDLLNDAELERGLGNLVARGREVDARVVAHLAEVEARQLHLKRGASSLFSYCQRQLNMSENQAFYRITAARVGRKFPVIFGLLERGELHLSAIALLSKQLTVQNHALLFAQSRGKTKLQILELLARYLPQADAANIIKRLLRPSLSRAVPAGPTGAIAPLSSTSYRLQLNISPTVKDKLELARDLMSHSNPSGDLSIVVERALDALIARLQSQRFGQRPGGQPEAARDGTLQQSKRSVAKRPTNNEAARLEPARLEPARVEAARVEPARLEPARVEAARVEQARVEQARVVAAPYTRRSTAGLGTTGEGDPGAKPPPRTRQAIPREVRRKLIERDGHRCSFVGAGGERCHASGFLQIHHVRAWAKGGADSLDNLRLLCAAHNRLLGELEFGHGRRAS